MNLTNSTPGERTKDVALTSTVGGRTAAAAAARAA